MPSRDLTSEDLFSSRMMSMQSSTHSLQMKTFGPAISLRTSCWLLPQKEQYRVFFSSSDVALVILISYRRDYSSFYQTPEAVKGVLTKFSPVLCMRLSGQNHCFLSCY